MKIIHLVLLLCLIPSVSAYDSEIKLLGGENIITPQYTTNDSHYLLYNDGSVIYSIYMTDYVGIESNYTKGFVGLIKHDQGIILNNNASYIIYADYDDIRDYSDAEVVFEKVTSYWNIIIYIIILLLVGFVILRVIKK